MRVSLDIENARRHDGLCGAATVHSIFQGQLTSLLRQYSGVTTTITLPERPREFP
jgi:hypothetical protein